MSTYFFTSAPGFPFRETRGVFFLSKGDFLMYAVSLGYECVRNITLSDVVSYIPKLAESYRRTGDALSILRGFGTYLYARELLRQALYMQYFRHCTTRRNEQHILYP